MTQIWLERFPARAKLIIVFVPSDYGQLFHILQPPLFLGVLLFVLSFLSVSKGNAFTGVCKCLVACAISSVTW